MIKINRTTDGAEKIKGIGWRFASYTLPTTLVLSVTYQKQAKLGYTILLLTYIRRLLIDD